MKRVPGMIEELCFAAEGLSGTAAAASLRKLGSIMERAPSGRLFAAISTLSDMSAKAAQALESGDAALAGTEDAIAAQRLGDALAHMDELAALSQKDEPTRRTKRRAAR
ncbi:hypothetical protein [Aestuariivirga sp.]|uniref:hypothetical protein n=1 Tax=Aestuariivirga sp. TaxID=2650926 RepID=UPI003BA94609